MIRGAHDLSNFRDKRAFMEVSAGIPMIIQN